MPRLLRWLSYLLGLIIIILVVGYTAAQVYKPTILEALNRELKTRVDGDIHIGGLDFTFFEQFPRFSVGISDIYVRGPRYKDFQKDIFHAGKIYIHIKLLHLLSGTIDLTSISVRDGEIFIYRTAGNYSNMDMFRKEKTDSTKAKGRPLSLSLGNVLLENTRFTFSDSLKGKSFDIRFDNTNTTITTTDSSRLVSLNGPMWFGGLTFNQRKGGYLSNVSTLASLNLEFITGAQRMVVRPSFLKFQASKVDLKGEFGFKAPGTLALSIHSDSIDYGVGLTLVTRALQEKLSKFQFNAPLRLDVNLAGSLAGGTEPEIDIAFSTSNNQFSSGKILLNDLSMSGNFTNHVDATRKRDDYNSRVALDTFSTRVAGIHTQGRLSITNLKDPELMLRSTSKGKLADLHENMDTTAMKFLSGTYSADIHFNGKLKEYLDKTSTSYSGKLLGDITVTDGALHLITKQQKIDKVNVRIHFTEKQMDLAQVDLRVNENTMKLKGRVSGFIPFFFIPEKKGFVQLSVYSPKLDLGTLVTKKEKAKTKSGPKDNKGVSALIDALDSKVEFVFNLKVDEVVNGPFHATNITGKMVLMDEQFSASPIKMNMAGGDVQVSVKMAQLNEPINPVSIKAEVAGADIEQLFKSFNNFNQRSVKSDNIHGKIFAKVDFNARLNEEFKVLMPSLDGTVELKIKNGSLKDFEPLQNLSNFLFKKRDFTDVQFAEINSRFKMSGLTVDISKMEVQSSVLTLFVQGKYSLADSTDLSIQVPLSNLKKRDKNYKPENVGVDAKVGPSVYLRAHNKQGKMVISYDPFKKFKKK